MNKKGQSEVMFIVLGVIVVILIIIGCFAFGPLYNVWQQGLEGQAELAKADYSKRVAVQEAQAKLDSATLLANAEIERAKGVAKANEIIGSSLKGNDEYLRYLWIIDVAGKDTQKTVVYVPTEASMPILEASRLSNNTNLIVR